MSNHSMQYIIIEMENNCSVFTYMYCTHTCYLMETQKIEEAWSVLYREHV